MRKGTLSNWLITICMIASAGCASPVETDDLPCPCASGWICCPAQNICVPVGEECQDECIISCAGKICGQDNGCGAKCTGCPKGQICNTTTWTCQEECTPSCYGKTCGQDDGCYGMCTACPEGQICNTMTWTCRDDCTPSCYDKTCGQDDGCDGKCTRCPGGQICNTAIWVCQDECRPYCSGKCGGLDGCGGHCPSSCPAGETCVSPDYTTCMPIEIEGGLVAWWPADGDALDHVGSNHGVITGNVMFTQGVMGDAFHFGRFGMIQTSVEGFPLGNSDRTLSLWVTIDESLMWDQIHRVHLAGYGMMCADRSVFSYLRAYTIRANPAGDAAATVYWSQGDFRLEGPAVDLETWHHIATTHQSGVSTFYIDGEMVASGVFDLDTADGPCFFGWSPSVLDNLCMANVFIGAIDDIRLYDRALEPEEILSLVEVRTCLPDCAGKTCGDDDGCGGNCMNCPEGQICKTDMWQCQGGCGNGICDNDEWCENCSSDCGHCLACPEMTAYWRLDEGSGEVAYDSARNHTGWLQSDPTWITGKVGTALSFDGSNLVTIADSCDLDLGTTDGFAVEALVRIPVGQRGRRRIVSHGSHAFYFDGYSLMQWDGVGGDIAPGGVAFVLGKDQCGEWLLGTCFAMDDGQWHHYAATARRDDGMGYNIGGEDIGRLEFYVDGVLLSHPCSGLSGDASWGPDGPGDITPVEGASTQPGEINIRANIDSPCSMCLGASCQNNGSCWDSPVEHFVGDVDEVAFYSRALWADEIEGHYRNVLQGRGYWDVPVSCADIHASDPSATSWYYTINPTGISSEENLSVWCDMDTDGGGWTLVMNYPLETGAGPAAWSDGAAAIGSSNPISMFKMPDALINSLRTSLFRGQGGTTVCHDGPCDIFVNLFWGADCVYSSSSGSPACSRAYLDPELTMPTPANSMGPDPCPHHYGLTDARCLDWSDPTARVTYVSSQNDPLTPYSIAVGALDSITHAVPGRGAEDAWIKVWVR